MKHIASITAISGFLQHEGSDSSNGIETLWLDRLRPLLGPRVFVNYRPWWVDWNEHAQAIWRCTRNADKVTIFIIGYSYGGGYGAVQLAKQLGKRGLNVQYMLLCDPVLHHGWPLRSMRKIPSFWSLFPLCKQCFFPLNAQPRIKLPKSCNKAHVEYWYQRNRDWSHLGSLPQGHHVSRYDGTPIDGHKINSGMTHDNVDNYRPFLDRCETIAQHIVQEVMQCD